MSTVEVAIYDLSQGMAMQMSQMSAQLLNGKRIDIIPHTGIRVFGFEWFYGGGIQSIKPAAVEATFGAAPKSIETLGTTTKSRVDLEAFLRSKTNEWTATGYDLWRHNCNNFSEMVAQFLTGQSIPSWILTLPDEILSTPLGQMLESALRPMNDQMNSALLAQGGVVTAEASTEASVQEDMIQITLRKSTDPKQTQIVHLLNNDSVTVADLRQKANIGNDARLVFLGKVLNNPQVTLHSLGLNKTGLTVLLVPPKEETLSIDTLISRISSLDCLKALQGICTKIIDHPDNEKYRKLKLDNATFQRKVGSHQGAIAILKKAGFYEENNCLVLTPSADAWTPLNQIKLALDAAIRTRAPPAVPPPVVPPPLAGQSPEIQAAMARVAMNPDMARMAMETMNAHPELARLGTGGQPPNPQRVQEIMRTNPQVAQHLQSSMMRIMQNPQLAQDLMLLSAAQAGQSGGAFPLGSGGQQPPLSPNLFLPGLLGAGIPPGGAATTIPGNSSSAPLSSAGNASSVAPTGGAANSNAATSNNQPPRPEDTMTEEEAINEAIRRSLREQ